MAVEIEAKMRIADLSAVREKLRAVGAKHVGHTNEINRFFDSANEKLSSRDQGLRLRTNTNADTGKTSHVVTMKGPRQAGAFKTREELEFSVDSIESATKVFQQLGYPQAFSFEKRRESWTLDDCKVELDELPVFGTFVEIEGPSEKAVEALRKKLNLQNEPSIVQGYASMVAKHLSTKNERELRFS